MSKTTDGNKVVRKIRMRAIAFLVFALVAGGIAVFLVKGYMDGARAAAERPERAAILLRAQATGPAAASLRGRSPDRSAAGVHRFSAHRAP